MTETDFDEIQIEDATSHEAIIQDAATQEASPEATDESKATSEDEISREWKSLEAAKERFEEEVRQERERIKAAKKRLKDDELFFDQKMNILKAGFAQLEADKATFEKEKAIYEATKISSRGYSYYDAYASAARALFSGVTNILALKKRYKDLLKMFHPDNLAGDHEMVVMINSAYEDLKKEYDFERQV